MGRTRRLKKMLQVVLSDVQAFVQPQAAQEKKDRYKDIPDIQKDIQPVDNKGRRVPRGAGLLGHVVEHDSQRRCAAKSAGLVPGGVFNVPLAPGRAPHPPEQQPSQEEIKQIEQVHTHCPHFRFRILYSFAVVRLIPAGIVIRI